MRRMIFRGCFGGTVKEKKRGREREREREGDIEICDMIERGHAVDLYDKTTILGCR